MATKTSPTLSSVDGSAATGNLAYNGSRGNTWRMDKLRNGLVWGKFSEEEDQVIKNAIYEFIKMHGWSDAEGLDKMLSSRTQREASGSWMSIASCLPHRPVKQVNQRAHRLLGQGTHLGKWKDEEVELLNKLMAEHSESHQRWKKIASKLGRSPQTCKDKWRVLKQEKRTSGLWTFEEYDRIFVLVKEALRNRAKRKDSDHRQIREDIPWHWVAEQMETRSPQACCCIWYSKLASPLVESGKWALEDDGNMLKCLMESGASSEEAVDWDNLLQNRDGLTCMERWNQMLKQFTSDRNRPFEDKVEILAKRYAPELLEC